MLLTILSSLAQDESRSISENSTWGIRRRFEQGKHKMSTKRFLGYDSDEEGHLIVNRQQAKIVVRLAGIVMFISAAVKNNVLTLLLSLAVVYGPMMIVEYLPYEMQKALDLIPLVGSSTDIFRTNTSRIFGKLIWSPYLLITIPVLIGILCMPFAIKSWSRRMKA